MRSPHNLVALTSIAAFTLFAIVSSLVARSPELSEASTFREALACLNAKLDGEMIAVGRPDIQLEENVSVYVTSTGESFAELNQLNMRQKEQWRGKLIVIKRYGIEPTAPGAIISPNFIIQGDPELLDQLR